MNAQHGLDLSNCSHSHFCSVFSIFFFLLSPFDPFACAHVANTHKHNICFFFHSFAFYLSFWLTGWWQFGYESFSIWNLNHVLTCKLQSNISLKFNTKKIIPCNWINNFKFIWFLIAWKWWHFSRILCNLAFIDQIICAKIQLNTLYRFMCVFFFVCLNFDSVKYRRNVLLNSFQIPLINIHLL